MDKIIIQLGSNIGDRKKNLYLAQEKLSQVGLIVARSHIYQTEAWGNENQQDFYNQLISMDTLLDPYSLLDSCKSIENKLGRTKELHWGPRIIDIDIIIYGNKIIFSPDLIIPHQYMHLRRFILEPLMEFENWIHPIFQKSTKQLLEECEDKLKVNRI